MTDEEGLQDEEGPWIEVGAKLECDGSAGEVYLESSRGKVPSLEECKQSCADAEECKSISYFTTGWCSHWSTLCTKTKRNKKVVMSLQRNLDFAEGGWFVKWVAGCPKCTNAWLHHT